VLDKIGNVLNALPMSAQPGAKAVLAEIYNAEDREHAVKAAEEFQADYGVKWPRAAARIIDDLDVLLAFYELSAEHWIHLRTAKPDRVHFRHRAAAPAGHQRARLTGRRDHDGVQADRVRTATLARGQRTTPRRARPRRRTIRTRHPRRTRTIDHRHRGGSLKDLDP